jgi:phosphopentomutase
LLVYGKHATPGVDLGIRKSLSDIGQTVAEDFGTSIAAGESFLGMVAGT